MNEILPGIFLIKEKKTFRFFRPVVNIYVLAGSDGIIFDAGYGQKRSVKKLIKEIKEIEKQYEAQNKPFKITRVLVSHSHIDHFPGLTLLRKYLGLKIVLTRKTAEIIKNRITFFQNTHSTNRQLLKVKYSKIRKNLLEAKTLLIHLTHKLFFGLKFLDNPDEIIDEPSEILINGEIWRIFSSPGHSSDHISIYNEEKGVLFAGDNIFRVKMTWLGPPDSNLKDYIKSLEYMLNLPNIKIILSSHGSPIENPEKRIRATLDHRRRRTAQVRKIVLDNSEDGITLDEMVKVLYPSENKMKRNIARGWIALTLKYWEDINQIRREEGKREIRFFPMPPASSS